jgi:DNA-directed RNA polymerase alpha subunit
MSGKEKSTDPGQSWAERKSAGEEAITDHEGAQQVFQVPDDTPIEFVILSTRIQNALRVAGFKTVGEVREVSDKVLISLPDFGKGSLSDLRRKLGSPSTDGVRPVSKKRG